MSIFPSLPVINCRPTPSALLETYGEWYQPERNGDRGRFPARRRKPRPDLLYAQVVKRREKGRVVEVTRQIVFGDAEAIDRQLAASSTSNTINTSFVERDNLTWRQHNRRLTRKTTGVFQRAAVDGKAIVADDGLLPFLFAA